jgi:hypothetical protein
VAGCATSTGFAGHAGATANLKLTFHPDHSVGANHAQARHRALLLALLSASTSKSLSDHWPEGREVEAAFEHQWHDQEPRTYETLGWM